MVIKFMQAMNLVFGCIDMVRGADGEYYFLEVNEQGQFLWIEENNPEIPTLQLVSDFLMSGNKDFVWERPIRAIRLSEIETEGFMEDFNESRKNLEYIDLIDRAIKE